MPHRRHAEIAAVFREHRRSVLAATIRLTGGNFDDAEEALQEALLAALEQWSLDGVPDNPRAWLFTAARNKAIDHIRRRVRGRALTDQAEKMLQSSMPAVDAAELHIQHDLLRLMFTCCHPALAVESQIALTLHTVAGLATHEIARAFLVPVATMAQRLVRAKSKIAIAKIPYEIPDARELPERLDAVLAVVYLIFNEGYAATEGERWVRDDLCRQAIDLGELLVTLTNMPSAHGLLALMLLHDARSATRTDEQGDVVLLDAQDRSRWNQQKIARGKQLVESSLQSAVTKYGIEAAIAALHSGAVTAAATDWPQVIALYDELIARFPAPVTSLNRAVAVAMEHGPGAGLAAIAPLDVELAQYYLFHATKADLLRRQGDIAAALGSYRRALVLASTGPEQRFLQRRIAELEN
jgi:RNA polymerase sigma-70 factor, ECF subfamily